VNLCSPRQEFYFLTELTILCDGESLRFLRAEADPSASPDFLSRVAASISCMWFSLGRTIQVVAGESCDVGNPGMVLMTKRRVGVSSGNWFEGSQVSKARPGAPFDVAERNDKGVPSGIGCTFVRPQVSPLRYAPVEMTILCEGETSRFHERPSEMQIPRFLGMTKERIGFQGRFVAEMTKGERGSIGDRLHGRKTADLSTSLRSGGDDNSGGRGGFALPRKVRGIADPSASPDFLSRVAASISCMWFSLGRTTQVAGEAVK
jgi:hypothetical protein